jgi:hypothetical protein
VKTDDLIKILGTNLEPVPRGQLRKTMLIALAIAVGAVTAICLLWDMLPMPVNAQGGGHLGFKAIALIFTLGLAAAGGALLFRSSQPGQSVRKPQMLIGLLLLMVILAGIVALTTFDSATWSAMIRGGDWGTCLICIPIFAVIPFVGFIWALRKGAPTRLALAGALAGLVAGALGAAAVVVHQTGHSIPAMVLWYGGPIVLCAMIGAILGPRLLRW